MKAEVDLADLSEQKRKAIMEFVLALRMFRKTALKIGGKERLKALMDHLGGLSATKRIEFLRGLIAQKKGVDTFFASAISGLIVFQLALSVDYGDEDGK